MVKVYANIEYLESGFAHAHLPDVAPPLRDTLIQGILWNPDFIDSLRLTGVLGVTFGYFERDKFTELVFPIVLPN